MLTIIADENIANLDDYFAHHSVKLIKMAGREITKKTLDKHKADALLVRSVTQVKAENLGDLQHNSLKFVGSATIGTDHIDGSYLAQAGVSFANAAGCSKHSVAQYVITAILSQRPNWYGQAIKLGIIGLGNIGSTLANYAKQLGWQVIGYDPFLPPSAINNSNFDTLLQTCDAISIHTPLTHTGNYPTFKLFNHNSLSKLSNNALLINTARGEIIDENALLADIADTRRTVILDVFPSEPTISDALMTSLAISTPHIAGYTLEGKLRGTDMIYQAFCRYFDLPIQQTLAPLLPNNPYHFADFCQQFRDNSAQIIAHFYDIHQDHHSLQAVNHSGVVGKDFDGLRKNYQLRREWLF